MQCSNSILYPKEDRQNKVLLYACRNCDHQQVADNNCVYRNVVDHAAGELTQVLFEDVASDPTLPRTKSVRCAACGHGEAVFFQVRNIMGSCLDVSFIDQLIFSDRFGDLEQHEYCADAWAAVQATTRGEDDLTLFFVCCNPSCGHRWRD